MKKIILLITLYLTIPGTFAQTWEWKQPEGSNNILKDLSNNLYIFTNLSPNFSIKKVNQYGTTLWTKTVTGNAEVKAFKVDASNNLVVVGNFTSAFSLGTYNLIPNGSQSFFILKFSPSAITLDAKAYGSTTTTFVSDLYITPAGDYIIGGGIKDSFNVNGLTITGDSLVNIFILKMDALHNPIWCEKSTMYTASGGSWLQEVVETASGKMYASIMMFGGLVDYKGFQFSYSGQYLIQLDSARNITWSKYLGYPGGSFEISSDIQTSSDTVYLKEYLDAPHFQSCRIQIWTESGVEFNKLFPNSYGLGYEVVAGQVYYAVLAQQYTSVTSGYQYRKIGTLTPTLSEISSDSVVSSFGTYNSIQVVNSSSMYIAGVGEGMGGSFVGKFSTVSTAVDTDSEQINVSVFPNPSDGKLNLRLDEPSATKINYISVLDCYGKCLRKQNLIYADQQIDLSDLAKGVYILEVLSGDKKSNKKIILN